MSLSHSFNVLFAEEYSSVEIAILINHFQFWIMVNKRTGKNFIEGRTWMYQKQLEIAAHFPYWSVKQVQRLISKMIDLEILIKGNFNQSKYDRTSWYAFKNEEKFSISRFREMGETKSDIDTLEIGDCINKDSETDTEKAKLASSAAFRLRETEENSAPLPNPLLKEMSHEKEMMKSEQKELHIFLNTIELENEQGTYVHFTDEQKMQIIRCCSMKKVKGILEYMQDYIDKGKQIKKGQVNLFFWCMHQDHVIYEDDKKSIEYSRAMKKKHDLHLDILEDFVMNPITGKDVTYKNTPHDTFVKRFNETFIKPITAPKLNESLSNLKEFTCV